MIVPSEPPSETFNGIYILGEAPGEKEIERGKPFVGPSGRVLNGLLATAGIARNSCFIANVFQEKAEGNDVGPWMRDAQRTNDALARIRSELHDIRPNIILALGATALWAVTGMDALARVRGSIMAASRPVAGIKLIPTLHPAFVMRKWEMYTVVAGDFQKAARESTTPDIIVPERKLWLDPTLEDLHFLKPKLLSAPLLSVDIETGWKQITHVGFAWSQTEGMSVPLVDLRQPDRSYWRTPEDELQAWTWLRDVLESPVPKLGQFFGCFDLYMILRRLGIRVRNYCEDTYQMAHAAHPELPRDLGFLGARYSEQGAWKHLGRRQGEDEKDNG